MNNPKEVHSAEIRMTSTPHFALAMLFIVSVFNYTDRYMIAILLPDIKNEFQLSDTQMGFLTGAAFTLFYVLMGLPIARLADRFSRKKLLSVALATWSLMTAACGLALSFSQLVVARILVGVGEAGSSPPSYSLIADLYPEKKRAGPMSIFFAGGPAGIFIGFLLGGWLAEQYGWRVALVAVALPGVLCAIAILRFLVEPPRGQSDGVLTAEAVPLRVGLHRLLSSRTFLHAAMGCALYNVVAVAYVNWLPSFFMRSHGLGLKETGTLLAFVVGPSQFIGMIVGGYIVDRISRGDLRIYMVFPAAAILVAVPMYMLALYIDHTTSALSVLFISLFIGVMQTAPVFAIATRLVEPGMRATTSAVLTVIINVLSGGLGPLAVGFASDTFQHAAGAHALRYALLIVTPLFGIWAALHYMRAARYIREDLNRVQARDWQSSRVVATTEASS